MDVRISLERSALLSFLHGRGKKTKTKLFLLAFRHLGSFYCHRRQSEKGTCKEIQTAFWKGHSLSVTPTKDFYPGDPWCLAEAQSDTWSLESILEPSYLCQVSTHSTRENETEPSSWFPPLCCDPSFSFWSKDNGVLPSLPSLSG